MTDLKPCPFCGGKAQIDKIPKWDWESREYDYQIRCQESGCIATSLNYFYDTEEAAIEAWNRRAKE